MLICLETSEALILFRNQQDSPKTPNDSENLWAVRLDPPVFGVHCPPPPPGFALSAFVWISGMPLLPPPDYPTPPPPSSPPLPCLIFPAPLFPFLRRQVTFEEAVGAVETPRRCLPKCSFSPQSCHAKLAAYFSVHQSLGCRRFCCSRSGKPKAGSNLPNAQTILSQRYFATKLCMATAERSCLTVDTPSLRT